MTWISATALVVVMTAAALSDLRSRRIPNRLVLAGLAVGLATRAVLGWSALAAGLAAAVLALVFGIALFSLGAMGAGDGKLMAVVGAFLGLEQTLAALMAAAVAGGVLSMVLALRRGVFIPVLLRTRDLAVWLLTLGRRGERVRMESAGSVTFPFGVAIAIGAVVVGLGGFRL